MPAHVTKTSASVTLAATAPASGTTETAASNMLIRYWWGSFNLTATVGNSASIALAHETGVGTGVYTTVANMQVGAGITSAVKMQFGSIPIPPGYRYKWTKGGLAGTTETNDVWNYTDVGV